MGRVGVALRWQQKKGIHGAAEFHHPTKTHTLGISQDIVPKLLRHVPSPIPLTIPKKKKIKNPWQTKLDWYHYKSGKGVREKY